MPPHAGHQFLIDFARAMVDHLYVLVCTLSAEPIPGELRYKWVQELAPGCTVIHITEENPAAARGRTGATTIWAETVRNGVPAPVTHVFASEDYGWDLAYLLEAQFVPVDISRSNIPVSASMIREDPYRHWQFIPPVVRPWFVRHVAVVNQRDFAEHLAEALRTVVVHPYGAFWYQTWNAFGGRLAVPPLTRGMVARGEHSAATALARQANRILIHDCADPEAALALHPDMVIADHPAQEVLASALASRTAAADAPLIIGPGQVTPEQLPGMLGISFT